MCVWIVSEGRCPVAGSLSDQVPLLVIVLAETLGTVCVFWRAGTRMGTHSTHNICSCKMPSLCTSESQQRGWLGCVLTCLYIDQMLAQSPGGLGINTFFFLAGHDSMCL